MFDDPESSLAFYVYTTLYNSQNLIAFTQIITIHKERVELEEVYPKNPHCLIPLISASDGKVLISTELTQKGRV